MKIAALKIERAKAEKNNIVCVKACGQSTIITTTALYSVFEKNILQHCDNLQSEIKLVQVGHKESETKFSLVVNLIKEVKLFPTLIHLNEW